MESLIHLPLEESKFDHTELLSGWESLAFAQSFNVSSIKPASSLAIEVMTGKVLPGVSRACYSIAQVNALLHGAGSRSIGKIYFSDFYTTGLDALPYSRAKFQAFAYCSGQTFDIHSKCQSHIAWMRLWEVMAMNVYAKVFVPCQELKELILTALPGLDYEKIEVVGLPFDSAAVAKLCELHHAPADEIDVVFTSSFNHEKNPRMFLDIVMASPEFKFAISTAHEELTGSDEAAVDLALRMEAKGRLKIYRNMSKGRYYAVLSRSRVIFNCAIQEWVGYTLLEALTFGCVPLYPNYRSFPDALMQSSENLYAPRNFEDAVAKLRVLLSREELSFRYAQQVLNYHNGALASIAQTMKQI